MHTNLIFQFTNLIFELSEEQKELIWKGNKYFQGLNDFFKELEEKNYKIQNRVMLSRYRGKTKCHTLQRKTFASRSKLYKSWWKNDF